MPGSPATASRVAARPGVAARPVLAGLAAAALALASACATASQPTADARIAGSPPPNAGTSAANGWHRHVDPFEVRDAAGTRYAHPFLGGIDVPRPQFIDIDGDGDLDLFMQERSDELAFFENAGTRAEPRYIWRTDRFQDLEVGDWTRFVDLDADGDFDLLAELPYSYVRYYRNTGTATRPSFEAVGDSLRDAAGAPIFADRQNLPTLADIDCDGSLDLFLGRIDGTLARYELVGSPAGVPRFEFITERFEDIEIVAQIIGSMRHGANAMAFADFEGDGDLDLFWGDFFEPGVLFIENTGGCPNFSLRSEPIPVPAADTVRTSGYNVPVPIDFEGDGDLDLFIGVLGGAFNPNNTAADNFYHLENVDDGPLTVRDRRFLHGIDVGNESVPSLIDWDGDGDTDLLIANKLDPANQRTSRLYLFLNRGDARAPRFELTDTLDFATTYHYAPAFGDLDADGDLDLLLGTWNDDVLHFVNEGTRAAPRYVQQDSPAVRLTRGSNSTPALADLDDDGDLDLLVGEASGTLNYYRNEGTAQRPDWVLVSDEWEGIDVGRRSAPAFADIDGDGDLDLVIGTEDGGLLLYRNSPESGSARFQPDPAFSLPLPPFSTPAFADLDGDGDVDLLVGGISGGLIYLENTRR